MKFAYKFTNLLGTIYRKGNVFFTPDGYSVVSPVGNKITVYDLKNNKSNTLSLESKYNYSAIDISPNGCLMVAVNENGDAQMISMVSQTVIHTYKFSKAAQCVKFSPDGKYFAVAKENMVFIFKSPGEITGEYNSFVVRRYFFGAHDDIVWIDWSTDSKILAVGSKDNSTKIYGVEVYQNFRPYLLTGHSDSIVGCFFEENSLDVNTISKNGQLCLWECSLNLSDLLLFNEIDAYTEPIRKRTKVNTNGNDNENVDNEDDDDLNFEDAIEKSNSGVAVKKADENAEQLDSTDGELVDTKKRHPFHYKRISRHFLLNDVRKTKQFIYLTSANYHKKSKLLITAFSNGSFYLYELPTVSMIHSLSISDYSISTTCFNDTGDWIALGVSGVGQLLVWEWQSEQYVMKQQGHSNEMTSIAYSADGQYIASGGEDSKVKLWNVHNGFCFVTFTEHTSTITDIKFSYSKKFLVSASLDGTVRAFDIIRYRNFRTFTSPRPVQFASVAIDYSGELIAAGGRDVFEIFVWSMKVGQLLEILSGHEGPVTALAFPAIATSTTLISGSWDKTIKIWNCLESSTDHETIDLHSDVTAIAFKPNGEEIAVATLKGDIDIFNVRDAQQLTTIEGRNDLGSGVSETDLITAKKNLQGKCFTSIIYSADGECILAGGKSKNVCIYNVKERILLKKFEITQNHSLDGLDDFINRRKLTEFGNLALIEKRDVLEGGHVQIRLPGVQQGDMATRNFKPEIRVFSIQFSPTGQAWAAATTEGLLIYSLDKRIVFDPYNLSLEVTPKSIRESMGRNEYSTALIMSLKLNEINLIQEIIEKIPYNEIMLVVLSLPDAYAQRSLQLIAKLISTSSHIEFYLKWANTILTIHGQKDNVLESQILLLLQQNISRKYESLSKICDFNKYTMRTITQMTTLNNDKNGEVKNENSDDEDEEMDQEDGKDADDDDDDDELLLLQPVAANQ